LLTGRRRRRCNKRDFRQIVSGVVKTEKCEKSEASQIEGRCGAGGRAYGRGEGEKGWTSGVVSRKTISRKGEVERRCEVNGIKKERSKGLKKKETKKW